MINFPNNETGKALAQFVANGWDIKSPMEIDFFVAVPSQKSGEKIALLVKKNGFKTSVEQDIESLEWTCYCTKTLIPKYDDIVAIEAQLNSISVSYGGYSDGFGSYGNIK